MSGLCRVLGALVAAAAASSCSHSYVPFEIRTRNPAALRNADELGKAYKEEFAYVRARRRELYGARLDGMDPALAGPALGGSAPSRPPANLIGLALSGGGIRSATFALGFMQALEAKDLLDQFDYMSAVSGGAYAAAWLQAHLGAQSGLERDRYAYWVRADSPGTLLDNQGDHVEQLRSHSGFLNQGGWLELPRIGVDWAWRWPFHMVLDDGLHWRGRYNFHHIIDIYRSRIEGTYFRGEPAADRGVRSIAKLRLIDVNPIGRESASPYLILNANLTNRGDSRVGVDYEKPEKTSKVRWFDFIRRRARPQWNFEFTRDFTGSDATGYIRSEGFGMPVVDVKRRRGHPVVAKVDFPDGIDASEFRLSEAVAASGAAFDSLAIGAGLNFPGVSELLQLVGGGVFNLNLGLDVPNFSRDYDGRLGSLWDRFRMFTYQRVPRFTDAGAHWLQITDGGHYENLGVLALLRRGSRCIVSVDATADKNHKFADLHTLRRRVIEDLHLQWVTAVPDDASQPVHRFVIQDANGKTRAVILYVKASADEEFPHMSAGDPLSEAQADALAKTERMNWVYADMKKGLEIALAGARQEPLRRQVFNKLDSAKRELTIEVEPSPEPLSASRSVAGERDDGSRARTEPAAAGAASGSVAELAEKLVARQRLVLADPAETAQETGARPPDSALLEPREQEQTDPIVESLEKELEARRQEMREAERAAEAQSVLRPSEIKLGLLASFEVQIEKPLKKLLSEDAAAAWEVKADVLAILDRARQRIERVELGAPYPGSRTEYVSRIRSFGRQSLTFPHNSTLQQWYEWERFEAYRLLGYQMASTYLGTPLAPDAADDELQWCNFPGAN